MPTITAGRERLNSVEFYPYKEVIPSGLMAIMTAHISIPALDSTPGLPATMSKPILTGVLRGELGFDGLVITDAFDMGGILEKGSFEESAVKSVIAGNDVVLLWTVPQFEKVFPHMLKAVEDGRISKTRLNESVRRNLITKARVGLNQKKLVDLEKISMTVGIPEHLKMATEIWKKSIVLVKNEGNILPLEKQNKSIVVFSVNDDKNHLQIGETFINETKTRGKVSNVFSADPNTSVDELNKALKEADKADVIVVALFARIYARRDSPSLINQHLIQFLHDLSKGATPVFVVSFGSPYLIKQLPGIAGYMIATEPTWEFYGYDKFRPGQIAAAKALFGETDITGKLAVTIPDLYPFGHGITFTAATQE
jgi:beta-N-acetylhexosaminidase